MAAIVLAAGGVLNVNALNLKECSLESQPSVPAEMVSDNSGSAYFQLSADGTQVAKFDYKTGKQLSVVMDSKNFRDCDIQSWDGFIVSPDEKLLLLYTDVEPIYRHSFKAQYYVYDIARNNIKPLSENGAQEIPAFSPDGRMVAFVRDNNVFVAKIDYGTELPVT